LSTSLELENAYRGVTSDQWQAMILDQAVFRLSNLKMINELANATDHKLAVNELANRLSIKVFGLNAQIVRLGKRVINKTGINRQIRSDGSQRYWNIACMGESGENFIYILRPEMLEAIDKVGRDKINAILDKSQSRKNADGSSLQRRFWEDLLEQLYNQTNSFNPRNATEDSWITFSSGLSGVEYGLAANQKYCYAYFSFDRSNQIENKRLYDFIYLDHQIINQCFDQPLEWCRLDDKKSSYFRCIMPDTDIRNMIQWQPMQQFLIKNLIRMREVMNPRIPEMRKQLGLV
jgi:hypothetical protein